MNVRRQILSYLSPLLSTTVLYVLCLVVSAEAFSLVKLRPLHRHLIYTPDFLVQLAIGYVLYFICQRRSFSS